MCTLTLVIKSKMATISMEPKCGGGGISRHKFSHSDHNLYINLRRSRDCLCVSVAAGRCASVLVVFVFVCVIALLHLLILGKCYAVHINASSL